MEASVIKDYDLLVRNRIFGWLGVAFESVIDLEGFENGCDSFQRLPFRPLLRLGKQ